MQFKEVNPNLSFQQGCSYGNRKEATNSIWMALVDIDSSFGGGHYGFQYHWLLKNYLWWLWGEFEIVKGIPAILFLK